MKTSRLKKYLLFSIILFNSHQIYSQVEEDSLVTEINSLLTIEVEENQFISSASKYDQSPEEAPSSTSIVTSDEIEAFGYETLSEILNSQSGFYLSDDRSAVYVGVRGFRRPFDNNNRILLLQDGVRLNGFQMDLAPLSTDVSKFDRIEIVRGPGSTLYGNNAVHAVVNLIPKKKLDSFIPIIKAKYGSFNTQAAYLQFGKKLSDKSSFFLSGKYGTSDGEDLYFKEYDSPETNDGWAIGKDRKENTSVFGQLNYSSFKLNFSFDKFKKYIPTARFNTAFNEDNSQFSEKIVLDLKWTPRLSYDKFFSFNIFYDNYNYGSILPIAFGEDGFEFQFNGETKTATFDGQFIWDILPNNRLIAGIEYVNNFYSSYKYKAMDSYLINDEWPYEIFSMYFQNEYQYNVNLAFYLGIRRDEFINQEVAYNPRAGVVLNLPEENTLKFLYGRSFRAPNLLERNLEETTFVNVKRNEDIKSEYINTYELIWSNRKVENLNTSLALYYYNMDGLIDQVPDEDDGLLQYVNLREVKALGMETEITYKLSSHGKAALRYSYQNAVDEFGDILTNSPEHLIKLLAYNKIYSTLNGAIEFYYETKRKTVFETYTEPITLVNLNLYSDPLLDFVVLSLKVNNLFDANIYHPAGNEVRFDSIIQPVRNYLFSIKIQL